MHIQSRNSCNKNVEFLLDLWHISSLEITTTNMQTLKTGQPSPNKGTYTQGQKLPQQNMEFSYSG